MATILFVDDDPLLRTTLKHVFADMGHSVVTASNGIEGLQRAAEGKFDLILTDIIMPDMEGIGMIVELRKKYPHAKIIGMSGGGRIGSETFLEVAKKLGANATLKKPFHYAELGALVSKMLAEEPTTMSGPK